MDKELATSFMRELMALAEPLNRATTLARTIENEDERKALLRPIGSVMNLVNSELIRPIIKQYPELDPDCDQRS
jgi:hypothetical protein